MTDDVKNLLGRALGQEPPLRIDRDEVIQQGRKRLRRRRLFEAGSVVAAVLVVAVGAVTLTNLADSGPQRMPPAASRTQSAPPGPALPLPKPSATVTTTTTPGVHTSLPSTELGTPIPPSVVGTGELTELLYNAGVVTQKEVRPVPGAPNGVPAFQQEATRFVYQADVLRTSDSGSLEVTIDLTPGATADCAAVPVAFGDCEIRGQPDFPVAVSQWRGADGERRAFAFTVMSDGLRIAAIASNISSYDRKVGRVPSDGPPVLSADQLSMLVVKVGVRVG
jgi:hypothetical protein